MGITVEYMAKRVRFRFWEATFYSWCSTETKHTRVRLLTFLRVRLAFGAPLEFAALSSEALRLPEASEGIMSLSGLLVIVEVMFIDENGGCCSPTSRVPSA